MKKNRLKVVERLETPLPPALAGLLDPEFKWTRGADVQKTWRKYGWVPPSELKTGGLGEISSPLHASNP